MQQMKAAWELDQLIVSDVNVLELLHLSEIDRVDGVQLIVIEDEEFQTLQVQQGRIDVRDRVVLAVESAQRSELVHHVWQPLEQIERQVQFVHFFQLLEQFGHLLQLIVRAVQRFQIRQQTDVQRQFGQVILADVEVLQCFDRGADVTDHVDVCARF